MLQLRDKRYNDIRIIFKEEGHTYTDTLGNAYKSMTTILGEYKQKFDKSYWLRKKSKELGLSTKVLELQWQTITDEACARGNKTHNGIEDGVRGVSMFKEAVKHLNRKDGDMVTIADIPTMNQYIKELNIKDFVELTGNKYPEIYRVLTYYVNNGYKIYAEIGGFLIDYLLSGMIDLLIIRDDKFVIGDWKTNRGGIQFSSGYYKKDKTQTPHQTTNDWAFKDERLIAPLNHMPSCNGSIYSLQLSGYAYFVETILGIPCAGLWIAHIDSDFELNEYGQPRRFDDGLYHVKENGTEIVTMHKINYYRDEFRAILEDRRRSIEATRVTGRTLFNQLL